VNLIDTPVLSDLKSFRWPTGKRAGLSLSFDDARLSQPDTGFEILDHHGVRATFYVSPNNIPKRMDAWKHAVSNGHEIGNHTDTHPCSGAFPWTRHNALEDYTLERITKEIDIANEKIHSLLGVTPNTFAYPCGHEWVGRGRNRRSYVPIVAERFLIARGCGGGSAIPGYVDTAMVPSMNSDQLTMERFYSEITTAIQEGRWLILIGHEIADAVGTDALTTLTSVLTEICHFATNLDNSIWIDTVSNIGTYVREQRCST
jgi:peptidoglycan/xylan/chitin deacetylase (PgdA/CDA1 family)